MQGVCQEINVACPGSSLTRRDNNTGTCRRGRGARGVLDEAIEWVEGAHECVHRGRGSHLGRVSYPQHSMPPPNASIAAVGSSHHAPPTVGSRKPPYSPPLPWAFFLSYFLQQWTIIISYPSGPFPYGHVPLFGVNWTAMVSCAGFLSNLWIYICSCGNKNLTGRNGDVNTSHDRSNHADELNV